MTRQIANPKSSGDENTLVVEQSREYKDLEKLINITGELSSAAEGMLQNVLVEPETQLVALQTDKKRFTAPNAVISARKQLEEIIGMKVDSISAVSRTKEGWEIIANVVELFRIPHSTDVLSSFTVHLDADGNLETYRRTSRYTRDQTGDDV